MEEINGFYEGSIIFGNRFKDTKMSVINLLDSFTEKDTYPAREDVYKRQAASTAAPTPLWNISRVKSWRCATGRGFTKSTS